MPALDHNRWMLERLGAGRAPDDVQFPLPVARQRIMNILRAFVPPDASSRC